MLFITWVSTTCFGSYGHLRVDTDDKLVSSYTLACVLCMVEGGWGWMGYEILCVLSREGDVGAWVLLCRQAGTIVPMHCTIVPMHPHHPPYSTHARSRTPIQPQPPSTIHNTHAKV